MKLTDIDLSSLAEVAAAVTLLEHVHRELATGGTPLPSLPPAAEFVTNPAPAGPFGSGAVSTLLQQPAAEVADPVPSPAFAALQAGSRDPEVIAQVRAEFGFSPEPLDAASVFGGAPAQSAAPLLQPAPSTAGVAASPTAPAAQPVSGALPTLQALAPLPAPAAAAPTAPVAHSSPAGGVELDADGLPWDERIHAGTKRKNADGRWTAKRGINDPDLVPRVVGQLRAQMAAAAGTPYVTTSPAPQVVQSAAPLPVSTPAPSIAPLAALPAMSGHASSAAPTPPAPQSLQPSSAAPTPQTYQDFMTAATVEVLAGRLPATAVQDACKQYGGTAGLATNVAAIPAVWAALKAQYPGML